jgi:hypothetical protein
VAAAKIKASDKARHIEPVAGKRAWGVCFEICHNGAYVLMPITEIFCL